MRGQNRVEILEALERFSSLTPILDAQVDSVSAIDVISIESSEVLVYLNAIENGILFAKRSKFDWALDVFLNADEEISIDIAKVFNSNVKTFTHMNLVGDVEPVVIHRLDSDPKFHDLLRFRLNDDELDDIMIFENRTDKAITGVVLLSPAP